jgi:hypothetical protein
MSHKNTGRKQGTDIWEKTSQDRGWRKEHAQEVSSGARVLLFCLTSLPTSLRVTHRVTQKKATCKQK